VTLTGTESQGAACGAPGCRVASTLQTTYKDWQVSAKMAGDYRFGGVTVTPWVMALGGPHRSRPHPAGLACRLRRSPIYL
jgi:hypothetical protein